MDQKIVEAVGLAHKPGRNTIKADLWRLIVRLIARLTSHLPCAWRTRAVIRALEFRHSVLGLPFLAGASKGDTFENDLQKLTFNATAIANFADNAATSPITNIQVSLHTADPGEAGDQTTNEIAYTGYARIPVARTSGGWTVTNNSVSPAANIDFGQMTAGAGGTVTHFIVGTAASGTGKILYSGTVTPNISVVNGVIPRLTTASTITED